MNAALRIFVVVLLGLTFVLSLVALLNYFKFQSSLLSLTERRLSVITADVRESVEAGLNLGLNLRHFDGAEAVLARARSLDPGIGALHIFGSDGRVIYSTDPDQVGRPVDREWLKAALQPGPGAWRHPGDSRLVLGTRLDSSFAPGIGGLALVYPMEGVSVQIGRMGAELAAAAGLTLLAFSVLGAIASLIAARRLETMFIDLDHAVEGQRPHEAVAHALPIPAPLQQAAAYFRDSIARAHAELEEVERQGARPGAADTGLRVHEASS